MTAREKLQDVLRGNYNLEFEVVEILKDGVSIAQINETVYIRQGGPFGGIMTIAMLSMKFKNVGQCRISFMGIMIFSHIGKFSATIP